MTFYPNQIMPSNQQDETNDVPGNDQVMNARDHNVIENELRAVQQIIGVLGSSDTATVLGALSDVRQQLSEVLEKEPTKQQAFDFLVSPGGQGDVTRIDAALYHLPVAGGSIRLDSGTHNVGSQLEMPVGQNVQFSGEGGSTVVLIADTITGFGLIRPTTVSFTDTTFKAASGSSTNVAIEISNGGTLYLSRCIFQDFDYAIKFTGTGGQLYIDDCLFQDSLTTSVHVAVDGGIVSVNGTRITHNSQNGVGIDVTDGEIMLNTTRFDDAEFGVRAIGDADLVISCNGAHVTGCDTGVLLSGATTATVVGNTLKSNTTANVTDNSTGTTTVASNSEL